MTTVICPNCGGENTITGSNGQECAYCGTMLQSIPKLPRKKSADTSKNSEGGKYIVPISSEYATRENIIAALKEMLVASPNVPYDIFDTLEIKDIQWFYLPLYRLSGCIDTDWTCDEAVYHEKIVGERPVYDSKGNYVRTEYDYRTYKDYVYRSGVGHHKFDMLVYATKDKEDILPSATIDVKEVDLSEAKPWSEGLSLTPAMATIQTNILEIDSKYVSNIITQYVERGALRCSYEGIKEKTKEKMTYCYDIAQGKHGDKLYFIPFVYVIYSYKGETYDWGFMQSPEHELDYDIPVEEENLIKQRKEAQEHEIKSIERKYGWTFVISLFLGVFVAAVIFFCLVNDLYERVKKRLKNQTHMFELLDKMKRRENAAKNGLEVSESSEFYDDDGWEEDEDDILDDDDRKPKSIAEIHQYFEETEVLKEKLLRRIKLFWIVYVGLPIIYCVVCGIVVLGDVLFSSSHHEEQPTLIQETLDATIPINNLGLPKDVEYVIIHNIDSKFIYHFDTEGYFESVIKEHDGVPCDYYKFTDGRLVRQVSLRNSILEGNVRKDFVFNYKESTKTKVSNGEKTSEQNILMYRVEDGVSNLFATITNDNAITLNTANLDYEIGFIRSEEKLLWQSMLKLIKFAEPKMPKEYDLLEGTVERPKRIKALLVEMSFVYKGENCSQIEGQYNQFVNGEASTDENDCAPPDTLYIPETEEDEYIYDVDEAVE